jgi:WD40 repeat protein/tRNA A-37 threonylcarbamoyl transferase component Bud32
MSERSIFLNALDREDPAERAAYLDQACAGRPELRRRIERLLHAHQVAGSFLEVPAPEQLARGEQALSFLAPSDEPGRLGRLDHYEVLEVVGRGATGAVLKARDTKLQRVVALKVLAPRLAASAPARQRFVREAQATAAVRDDHVIAIHAVNDDGPIPYLVMEYIAGVTLEERIRDCGPPDLAEILRIGMQVASGLAAAHAQGLIHRDIKPGNILLENGVQRVKITDFGLAGAVAAGQAEQSVIAGTPAFMAPCQARGEPTTERSDLFSLGAVMYALCTGRPPFEGDTTAAVLKSVCDDTPRPIRATRPDLPDGLCGLIDKLMAKDPGDRFGSAREVADLLTGELARLRRPPAPSQPGAAPAAPPAEKPTPPPGGSPPRRATLLVSCLLGLLVGLSALAAVLKPWQRGAPGPGDTAARERTAPARPIELRREDIPPALLALAGSGDPDHAPPELAAVLGDGRFLLPRVGQTAWTEQSPDGRLLAVPLDEDVVLFDAATGAYLRTLKGPGGRAFTVTFSRDGRLLAAGSRYEGPGGAVRVWDLPADRELFTNPVPGLKVSCATIFSADGRRLFTEGDGKVYVWDSRSGREVLAVPVSARGVAALGLSPDGRRLAVADWEGCRVRLFDWDGDRLAEKHALEHPWYTTTAVYSPDGKWLATSDLTGFKLWNAETLEEAGGAPAQAQQIAFAPDGRTFLSASSTVTPRTAYTVTRWDVNTRKELSSLEVEVAAEPVCAFQCVSRDGKALFVTPQHDATYVKVIDTDSGRELYPRRGHAAPLHAVAVSPDGRTVASAGADWVVNLWDAATGRVLHTLRGHTGAVDGLAFSPDGKRLASGSRDGTIALWDVADGTIVRALLGHSRSFSRLRFSPDGRTLAAGGERGVVKLWDADTGREREPLSGHAGTVRCVAFSPDGRQLASGGDDRTVRLHDLAGGSPRSFQAPAAVNDVAFSPDGRSVAAVGEGPDGPVRLWGAATGAETSLPGGHTGAVFGLAFSPSAPLLATCGADGTVRLWDRSAANASPRTIGPGPFGGAVRSVAFTPDGRYLLTANANGMVYVLRVGDAPAK